MRRRRQSSVFVNAPIDVAYEPLFEAMVFTISACGYRVRTALEESDSGDIRLDKLVRLIRESSKSIHDLSRVGEDRFNMPFELGLALGAKLFGKRARDRIKIMVGKPYAMPAYLSDLGGNDPDAHAGDPTKVIRIVRNFLHSPPAGGVLPGATHLTAEFERFKAKLPDLAKELNCTEDEVRPYQGDYRTFAWCVTKFLEEPEARA
jgi:hypothetical protein